MGAAYRVKSASKPLLLAVDASRKAVPNTREPTPRLPPALTNSLCRQKRATSAARVRATVQNRDESGSIMNTKKATDGTRACPSQARQKERITSESQPHSSVSECAPPAKLSPPEPSWDRRSERRPRPSRSAPPTLAGAYRRCSQSSRSRLWNRTRTAGVALAAIMKRNTRRRRGGGSGFPTLTWLVTLGEAKSVWPLLERNVVAQSGAPCKQADM